VIAGSLFSGAGGMDLGLERAGWRIAWQVEIDPKARAVLAKHWPDVPRHEDVKHVGRSNLDAVDLICGGFPCQPVSVAGRRRAQSDDRWLWPEFARIVRELRPRYVLVENVSGLLSAGFSAVLGDLAAIGYDAEWDSICASEFGLPQPRERVFLVAYPAGERGPGLVAPRSAGPAGPRWTGCEADLRALTTDPFDPGPRWPEPLVRGMDDRPAGWVDRLRGIGNAVVPDVAEWIGRRLLETAA
jgi:DNA (cytosine-5)-methyltransferase 1